MGLTLRQSGTFIGIDKVDGAEMNDYNDKLYGQWFVVKVDHTFEAGLYHNTIYAVKLHRHQTGNKVPKDFLACIFFINEYKRIGTIVLS